VAVALAVLYAGCATKTPDRCYLTGTRYVAMRTIFEQTGSYQRAAQAMKDEGWAQCEINAFRYRLRKDLNLETEEFRQLLDTAEPPAGTLDFNPGSVEKRR